jgi:hypothetical protein
MSGFLKKASDKSRLKEEKKAGALRLEMDWIFFWNQAHFAYARENIE